MFVAPERDNIDRLKRALRSVFDDPHIEEISADDRMKRNTVRLKDRAAPNRRFSLIRAAAESELGQRLQGKKYQGFDAALPLQALGFTVDAKAG